MEIRPMEQKDLPFVAELEKQCFSDPWSLNSISSELNNPLSCWLVAEQNGAAVGYVGSQTVLDSADVMNIAVCPEFRRNGIAKKLILALCDAVSAKGAIYLMLEVRASNAAAIGLYDTLGFLQVGVRHNYYRNPREDAYILRKELMK